MNRKEAKEIQMWLDSIAGELAHCLAELRRVADKIRELQDPRESDK